MRKKLIDAIVGSTIKELSCARMPRNTSSGGLEQISYMVLSNGKTLKFISNPADPSTAELVVISRNGIVER
tara:strand:+ start:1525 stop:1737 length:213 start_codon:yes stop_codon:yes gene_type:complete